ncbi:MAG: hypothetical protein IT319_02835 [Anaerolineae bacterium]|nr:hypothetical protein [Anaerolineae bacterium]
MARRRSQEAGESRSRRKSEEEARAERVTWALLVLVFAVIQLLPETTVIPTWVVPLAGAAILLGSAIHQYSRRWPVSPITWIAGAIMAVLAYYSIQIDRTRPFTGEALLVFFVVIIFGVITGET